MNNYKIIVFLRIYSIEDKEDIPVIKFYLLHN